MSVDHLQPDNGRGTVQQPNDHSRRPNDRSMTMQWRPSYCSMTAQQRSKTAQKRCWAVVGPPLDCCVAGVGLSSFSCCYKRKWQIFVFSFQPSELNWNSSSLVQKLSNDATSNQSVTMLLSFGWCIDYVMDETFNNETQKHLKDV